MSVRSWRDAPGRLHHLGVGDRVAITQLLHRAQSAMLPGEESVTPVRRGQFLPWHRNLGLLDTAVGVSRVYPISSFTCAPGFNHYIANDAEDVLTAIPMLRCAVRS